jgi:hypothetical protein
MIDWQERCKFRLRLENNWHRGTPTKHNLIASAHNTRVFSTTDIGVSMRGETEIAWLSRQDNLVRLMTLPGTRAWAYARSQGPKNHSFLV